ncbi:MAG TPA: alpha/beta fold hydrolase [Limnochorda sp.]
MDPHTWRVKACGRAVGLLVLAAVLAGGAAEAQVASGDTAFTFWEEPVILGEAPWQVEGSLVLPAGVSRFPGVVLVPGFGPYDRDATTGLDTPLRDLAQGLAQRGIASIRFDKRTLVHGPKMDGKTLTVETDLIQDALAAARALREREGLEALFIVGHGLGATLAPEIAQRAQADGVVMLAPLASPLDELVLRQLEEVFRADGLTPEEEGHLERARAAVDQIRQGLTDPPQTYLGPARYFVDLRQRDPLARAESYPGPMLIIHGTRDQVVPASEFTIWQERLWTRPDVTFRIFPFLNHTFTRGSDSVLSTGFRWRRQMAPEVIETVARWILGRAPVEAAPPGEGLEPPQGTGQAGERTGGEPLLEDASQAEPDSGLMLDA